jgi:pyruvate dehydrogenase E2 component (dihydrolipoamide acetyltransferase)
MATNVVMPKMGESISEGTILRWLKKEGDKVEKDEPILEISTDKVDTEVPSPVAGTLIKILAQEKQTVAVGEVIASIGQNGEAAGSAQAAQPAPNASAQPPTTQAATPPATTQAAAQAATTQPATQPAAQSSAPAVSGAASGDTGQAVVMPKMGESISEGTILRWLKKEGDKVAKDEPILEISTDKVDTEVPSPFEGTLTKILQPEKAVVPVGGTLAYVSTGAGGSQAASASTAQTASQSPAQSAGQPSQNAVPAVQAQPSQPQYQTQSAAVNDNRFYSPLVKSIAKGEGISPQELSTIQGSGLGGRVNKNDMLQYVDARKSGRVPASQQTWPSSPAPARPAGAAQPSSQSAARPMSPFVGSGEPFTILPMDNIRQKIAEHMVRSTHTSAHVTSVTEADVTNIVSFRSQNKDEFKRRYGVNLTYTPILIQAMVRALREYPFINASIDGTNIVVKNDINFGVAVSLPQQEGSPLPPALIVPVIKQADRLSLAGIAQAVADLANRARTKKLTPDDISGGTFTLTNPGMYGNLFGTPIINQPQLAIMTTGAIVKRVVVKTDPDGNDYMAIRSMMYLGLSYDHRLIDGMYGVQYTERVKELLENFGGEM